MKKSDITAAYLEQAELEHQIALAEENPNTTTTQLAVLHAQRDAAAARVRDLHSRWQIEKPGSDL